MSHTFAAVATVDTFPVLAFVSAGFVNFFVPSGSGQAAARTLTGSPTGQLTFERDDAED